MRGLFPRTDSISTRAASPTPCACIESTKAITRAAGELLLALKGRERRACELVAGIDPQQTPQTRQSYSLCAFVESTKARRAPPTNYFWPCTAASAVRAGW